MFVGFELAAALGEETADPARSIPTAIIATILICGLFYVLTQYVGAIGSGGPEDLAFDFAVLADHYVGGWLGTLVELAVLLDIVAVGIGFTAGTSRGLFTLARDGLLPSRLHGGEPSGRADDEHPGRRRAGPGRGPRRAGRLRRRRPRGRLRRGRSGRPMRIDAFTVTSTIGAFVICVVYVLLAIGGIVLLRLPRPRAGCRHRRFRRPGDRRRRRRGPVHRRHRAGRRRPLGPSPRPRGPRRRRRLAARQHARQPRPSPRRRRPRPAPRALSHRLRRPAKRVRLRPPYR